MVFYAILYAIGALFFVALMYGLYKIVWYLLKILALNRFINKLIKKGVKVERKRKIIDIFFGKKGEADFIIEHKWKKYEVSVLSFISTHGRWNIEKTRTNFFIESRRASEFFYKKYSNSGEPDHVGEYKNDARISRKELYITQIDTSFEKQILLLYPYPKRITYTDAHYNEIYAGSEVEKHVVMGIDDLKKILFSKKIN